MKFQKLELVNRGLHSTGRPGHTVYKCLSLASTRRASRFSICGAMRRIFYLYIITHRPRVVPFFPPSLARAPLHVPLVPSFSSPFLTGPISPLLRVPRFPYVASLFLSPVLLFSSLSPTASLPPAPPLPVTRASVYLFYFIIKQTSSCHPLAPTCVFTRTHGYPSTSNAATT